MYMHYTHGPITLHTQHDTIPTQFFGGSKVLTTNIHVLTLPAMHVRPQRSGRFIELRSFQYR